VRITSFLPLASQVTALSLSDVKFHGLKQLVVLAGPNGSGKSRILQLLKQAAASDPNRVTTRANLEKSKKNLEQAILQNEKAPAVEELTLVDWSNRLKETVDSLERLNCIRVDEEVDQFGIVNFVPRGVVLVDALGLPPNELKVRAERARATGVESLGETAISYIQLLQNRSWTVTHQNYVGNTEDRDKAVEEYGRLKALIDALLGANLSRSLDNEATLFDKPIGISNLSDGQRVLLQLAVAVHPKHDERGIVLTMDEPENHLHPAALISILDRVRLALPKTQIWIATHSVPLLAHLYDKQPDCLHFVDQGVVTYAGTKPQLVLKGLLGDDHEQAKLLRFVDLPHCLAALQFAASCLMQPTVADHQFNDTQLVQIRTVLNDSRVQSGKLKILDFGAGKARLLGGLAENRENVRSAMNYVAFDASTIHKSERERQISDVYGSAELRSYSDLDGLFTEHQEGSFDAVVMCNVLHEIDPDDWLMILGEAGPVYRALAPDGHLLLVEDFRLPVGELPNPRGFFLLNKLHLQRLFGLSKESELNLISGHDARGDGRLLAHVIPRHLLARLSAESRKAAIVALQSTCAQNLKSQRQDGSSSYKAGQLNALWSQQYVNCALYLQTM